MRIAIFRYDQIQVGEKYQTYFGLIGFFPLKNFHNSLSQTVNCDSELHSSFIILQILLFYNMKMSDFK